LADAVGVYRDQVGMLEREENTATLDALEKLAAALSVLAPRLIEKPTCAAPDFAAFWFFRTASGDSTKRTA